MTTGIVGRMCARRLHPDGTAVAASFFVQTADAILWAEAPVQREAANEDHFFGPTAAA